MDFDIADLATVDAPAGTDGPVQSKATKLLIVSLFGAVGAIVTAREFFPRCLLVQRSGWDITEPYRVYEGKYGRAGPTGLPYHIEHRPVAPNLIVFGNIFVVSLVVTV